MELREYAERILYGTTLADKLVSPAAVTDQCRGQLSHTPDLPGRPHALRLVGDAARHKVGFPGLHELENARTRGHVLHFFANHELLALELMALMLLKFPDAPPSFRRGMYHTMAQEQGHLRLYKMQMERAQVEFGEIPVNAFFWRMLRDIRSPLEFVTGMSMTFEQANLDFSGYYARAFRRIGDIETADVLDVVYDEEIGHVKHGVVWFDRWRPKEQSRFRAYEVLLPPGLSPIRAKGRDFDTEARRSAGLDDDFIAHLKLYRASRGRPPRVLWFNAGVELESRSSNAVSVPKGLRTMASDLGLLMGQLASEEDILVADRVPEDATRAYLDRIGLPLPAVVKWDGRESLAAVIPDRHIGHLMPWGVSPASARAFESVCGRLTDSARDAFQGWNHGIRIWDKARLHPLRVRAVEALHAARGQNDAGRVVAAKGLGGVLDSLPAVDAWNAAHQGGARVFKAPFGASGRGAIRVFERDISPDQRRWMERTLRIDGAVVAEPWYARVADLSWHMDVHSDGVVHVGFQRFLADARGQYGGTLLHRMADGLPTELLRWIHHDGRAPRWLRNAQKEVANHIGGALMELGYRGPVGIDAMILRDVQGYALHPVVEINTRYTMGRIVLELEKRIARRRSAVMLILRVDELRARHGDLAGARAWAEREYPVRTRGVGPEKTVDHGVVWLTCTSQARAHAAVLLVGDNWRELQAQARGLSADAERAL